MENTAGTVSAPEQKGFIDRNALKYIVIVAMLLDHIAAGFNSYLPEIVVQLFHLVGRLTGPTMAFFMAEGFMYTHSVDKYQKRLGIFALISWLPFIFFEIGVQGIVKRPGMIIMQSVLFTLFLGITALKIWVSEKYNKSQKIALIFVLCLLSLIGDWPVMDVLAPLFLYIYKDDKKKKYIALCLVYSLNLVLVFVDSWYHLGILFVPLIIKFCYNGQCGKRSPFHKWFFYVFYPLHLLILGILKWYVF